MKLRLLDYVLLVWGSAAIITFGAFMIEGPMPLTPLFWVLIMGSVAWYLLVFRFSRWRKRMQAHVNAEWEE